MCRLLTDSLTDQIEFANVILLNKTDMMTTKQVDRIEQLVKTLNPWVRLSFHLAGHIAVSELDR